MSDTTGSGDKTPVEITLLRQENLPLIASVVNAAFTGEYISEIPRFELLRVIKSMIDRFEVAADTPGRYGRTPDYYLSYWTGSHSDSSWFGSRQAADGATYIYLLAPAARVIEFFNGCQTAGSMGSDGDSAMDRLFDEMVQGAARLSGDVEARRANIKAQISRLQNRLETIEDNTPVTDLERQNIFDRISRAYSDVRTAINALSENMRETNRKEIDRVNAGSVGQAIREYRARLAAHHASPAYRALQAMREHLIDGDRRAEVASADHVLRSEVQERNEWDVVRLPSHVFDSLAAVTTQIHEHDLRSVEIQNSLIDSSSLDTHRHLLSLVNDALESFREIRDTYEPSRRNAQMRGDAVKVPQLPNLDFTSLVRLTTEFPEMTVRLAPAPRVLPGQATAGSDALRKAVARSQHLKAREAQIMDPTSVGKKLSELLTEMPIRYGVEEIVRCFDVCARKVPSSYCEKHMLSADIHMDGIDRLLTAPDPLILGEGAPSQGHQEVRDILDDMPGYPFINGELHPGVDLRKIEFKNEAHS